MSENENDSPAERKIKRASENKRAYRLRKRPDDQLSQEEREWLANYDINKRQKGKPYVGNMGVADADKDGDGAGQDDGLDEPSDATDDVPPPPPPPPPRVNVETGADDGADGVRSVRTGRNWRSKYAGGQDGREKTVLVIASQWRGILQFMSDQITLSGGTPMISVESIWPALVMTVDDVLPEKVAIKPAHIAAVGTTVLLTQRIARHKKVGEAIARGESMPTPQPVQRPAPEPVVAEQPSTEQPTQEPPPVVPQPEPPIVKLTPDPIVEFVPEPGAVY
jgi:hypothetical protein